MYCDPSGHEWWHWLVGGLIVVGLAAATIISAGGFVYAYGALILASNGIASASMATTILAFATVAATTVYAWSLINGIGDFALSLGNGNSFTDALSRFGASGENAMWTTLSATGFGALGGYASYKQQIGSQNQAGLMSSNDRAIQRNGYWKSIRETPNGRVIHHPYGVYGTNRNIITPMAVQEHKTIHSYYGYKTNGGQFYSPNPTHTNVWDLIRMLFGF